MSTTPTPPAESPKPTRVKKRIYIPLILLLVFLAVAVVFYVRGTWADTEIKNPAGPDAGTLTQLYRDPDGNVAVRCAVVVDASPKETWAVVSNYASHHDFVPHITHLEEKRQPDGKVLIEGKAHTRVWGDFDFKTLVTKVEKPDEGIYESSWSHEGDGDYKINRGGWSLKPFDKDKKQTLLVFTLQADLKGYPDFIVRNIVMDRLHSILKAMRDETLKRKKGGPVNSMPH